MTEEAKTEVGKWLELADEVCKATAGENANLLGGFSGPLGFLLDTF